MSADEVDIKANSLDERAISVESDNDALSELVSEKRWLRMVAGGVC